MAPHIFKTGPGVLVLGEELSEQNISVQVLAATVEWDIEDGDVLNFLSGDSPTEDDVYTASLNITLAQDLRASGIVRWSWANKGDKVPAMFIPNNTEDAQIDGIVKVRPINVGGEVKTTATSDVVFPFDGEPTIGDIVDD